MYAVGNEVWVFPLWWWALVQRGMTRLYQGRAQFCRGVRNLIQAFLVSKVVSFTNLKRQFLPIFPLSYCHSCHNKACSSKHFSWKFISTFASRDEYKVCWPWRYAERRSCWFITLKQGHEKGWCRWGKESLDSISCPSSSFLFKMRKTCCFISQNNLIRIHEHLQ